MRKPGKEILITLMVAFEAQKGINIKVKNQEKLSALLFELFESGKVPGL